MAAKTIGELTGDHIGKPCQCPHCGKPSREMQVQTIKGRTLTAHIPPVGCCLKNRRGA